MPGKMADAVVLVADESEEFMDLLLEGSSRRQQASKERSEMAMRRADGRRSDAGLKMSGKVADAGVTVADESEEFMLAIRGRYSPVPSGSETSSDELEWGEDVYNDEEEEEPAPLRGDKRAERGVRVAGMGMPRRGSCQSLVDLEDAAAQSAKPGLMRRSASCQALVAPAAGVFAARRSRQRSFSNEGVGAQGPPSLESLLEPPSDEAAEGGGAGLLSSHSYAYLDAEVADGADFDPGVLEPMHASRARCSSYGLAASEVEVARRTYGANQLPAALPDMPAATFRAIAYVLSLRPAAYAAATLASTHLVVRDLLAPLSRLSPSSSAVVGVAALGVSAAIIGGSRFLERYVRAFDRLHEHVRLAQYALHRQFKGVAEEALCLVTREGARRWVPCSELVPGDILHLEEGRVPTDCMLLSTADLHVACPLAKLPFQSATPRFLSTAWWREGGGGTVLQRKIRLVKSESDEEGVALATSIVKSGKATAVVIRTGQSSLAYQLLSRLSSLSLADVLMLYVMGGVPPHPTHQWRV